MLRIIAAIVVGALVAPALAQQPTTYRDAQGRSLGTAVRNGDGTTTFRDAQGRLTGTATNNRDGTHTYRDSRGRLTGTSTRR